MTTSTAEIPKNSASDDRDPPFGVNEMRLSAKEWIVVTLIVLTCATLVPHAWKRFESFNPGPDYRIPYSLSKDYWLFQRRLETAVQARGVILVGDSVIWGEYVRPDGTLSHYLNRQAGQTNQFVNCGVNGLFPLALEGLLRDYGGALRNQKVLLHCNMLWITSPKADLSIDREETFNHSRLVPQFSVRIPCYRADANDRLTAILERNIGLFSWVNHLDTAYYDQKSIPNWTLEDDGRDPPGYPNAWRNPLAPLSAGLPHEPDTDPDRGPSSRRHKPWNASGADPTEFEWVNVDGSLQWKAFERLVTLLRDRGNDVLVAIGPFNEHMIAQDQHGQYRAIRDDIRSRLSRACVPVIVPETLATNLYADASHPLTEGYAALARELSQDPAFQKWLTNH